MRERLLADRLKLALSAILVVGTGPAVHPSIGQDRAPTSGKDLMPGTFQFRPRWAGSFTCFKVIDSYVGVFAGDGVRLDFDFGLYSNPLDEFKGPTYLISEERIGGFSAKIVCPRESGHGVTGIYFPELGHHNKLTVETQNLNAAQQRLVLAMFHRIEFR